MIYKQVRLHNYAKLPADGMKMFLSQESRNMSISPVDRYIASAHLKMMDNLDKYVRDAQCFNLSGIQHIVCPEKKEHTVFKEPVFPPYNILWLEEHVKTLKTPDNLELIEKGIVWFTLYVKNGFETDVRALNEVRRTENSRGANIPEIPDSALVENYTVFMGAKSNFLGIQFPYCMVTWFSVNNVFFQGSNGVMFFVPTSPMFKDVPKDNFSSDAAALARFCKFLEIKNVRVESRKINLTPREIRHLKHGKEISQRVIMITKPGKQYIGKTTEDSAGSGRPLHLCRGHVREYTNQAPLFGKYTGRFFIHEHLRGDSELGKIEKEYRIKERGLL